MKIKKLRVRSPSASLMIAILQIIGGGGLSILFTASYIITRVSANYTSMTFAASLVSLQMLVLSAALLCRGIWNCVVYGKYRKLGRAIIGRSGATSIRQVCEETGLSLSTVFSDIKHTMSGRYWSGYGLTDTTFVLSDYSKNSGTVLAGLDMTFQESTRRSHASLLFFAAVWVLFAIFPGLNGFAHYILACILSLAALFFSAAILPKTIVITQKSIKEREYKPEPVNTGVEETDDLLKQGLKHYSDLVALDKAIDNPKLDKPVRELLDITTQIFDCIKKSPEKSKQIRQFVSYYLPTTIKLLKNYDELARQPVKGENIMEAIGKIEGVMDGIRFTFRQQLDDLYRDKNIDISAEISVMENMIGQDDILSANDTGPKL